MEATLYNQKGKEAGSIKLPEGMFGAPWKADLVHQVIEGMRSNARQGNANTKGLGEVRGGGRKPWKQKGTGRARHGSSRSPIWVGGGVSHGPKSTKNYKVTLTKSMKASAFASLLSKKYKNGEVLFVDAISLKDGKTKEAADVMKTLAGIKGFERMAGARKPVVFVANALDDKAIARGFRNIPSLDVGSVRLMSALDIATHKYVVFFGAKDAIDALAKKA